MDFFFPQSLLVSISEEKTMFSFYDEKKKIWRQILEVF